MAKGKVADFQVHMKSEDGFQSNVLEDDTNLWVVDVYTEWCGSCSCALNTFQKANIMYNDRPIKFGTASSGRIPFLSRYAGTSQPTFMFLAGKGKIIDVVRGVNVPLIQSKMKKHLELEEKIRNGDAERVEFVDDVVATPVEPEPEEEEEEEEEEEDAFQQVTVALIKPDAVANGKVEEILNKLEEAGIEVVYKLERSLTREDAEKFYEEHKGQDFFLQLVDYMTSGPIVALALAAKDKERDVVEQWRLLIGPKDVAIAREEAPESLRATFASGEEAEDNFKNALHGSDSAEHAARELAFFFPNFHKKRQRASDAGPVKVQRTLALIRPDALRKYKDEIIEKIRASGFEIANAKEVSLTKEQAGEFYKEHEGQEYFDKLVTHMSSGPVMALALCREEAVTGWRDMLGPKNVDEARDTAPDSSLPISLRAQFVEDAEDPALNALHGSDSLESAEREVNFFFPKQQTLAVIKPDATDEEKALIMSKIRSGGFHIAAQKETVLTKEVAEQFYAEHNGKDFFGELTDFMTSGPTMFMVLSREDAISGMREIVGPADPEEAKISAPDSIRAAVGKDKLKNAIHAASDEQKAREAIKLAFGDELEFDEHGKVIEHAEKPDDSEIEGTAHAEGDAPAEGGAPAEGEPAAEPVPAANETAPAVAGHETGSRLAPVSEEPTETELPAETGASGEEPKEPAPEEHVADDTADKVSPGEEANPVETDQTPPDASSQHASSVATESAPAGEKPESIPDSQTGNETQAGAETESKPDTENKPDTESKPEPDETKQDTSNVAPAAETPDMVDNVKDEVSRIEDRTAVV